MAEPLLVAEDLVVEYPRRGRTPATRAVRGVDLTVHAGESVGLVGESGSGKSSIGAALLGLAPIAGGTVHFDGVDITHARGARRRALTSEMQVVFQDPYSSLNPSRTIGQTLAEPLLVHRTLSKADVRSRIADMLQRVGLEGAAADRYPSQFSGGQRQRIAVARALMVSPRLVVCDEAVSALDLSVQAQVLNLLLGLQEELRLSFLFISHDLDVVRHMADRVVVLYRGLIMEEGDAETVCRDPGHPYTQATLAAVPVPDPGLQATRRAARNRVHGAHRAPASDGHGCAFVARCPFAVERCEREAPVPLPGPNGALVACHRRDEIERPETEPASRVARRDGVPRAV